ncbi:aldo/keto reductase [Myxococcota bacterium]
MLTRRFGSTAIDVSIIGQGTWMMETDNRTAARTALRRGLDLGMLHIDTAEMYGAGAVEELVGEAIAGRRQEVFLSSKVLPSNASYEGTLRACERSLRRLRTDWLDLYLLHWPGVHPLSETFAAFERLVDDGKIRVFGVSNFDGTELDIAEQAAGPGRMVCNQVLYDIRERAIEHQVIPWCDARGVSVVGYRPFGVPPFPSSNDAGGKVLAEIAIGHGATTRQVVLAFLTRRSCLFAIPKASSVEHVEENAWAGDLVLAEEEIARLDTAFERGPEPSSLPWS